MAIPQQAFQAPSQKGKIALIEGSTKAGKHTLCSLTGPAPFVGASLHGDTAFSPQADAGLSSCIICPNEAEYPQEAVKIGQASTKTSGLKILRTHCCLHALVQQSKGPCLRYVFSFSQTSLARL